MKKIILIPILLFCISANAQLFNSNPKEICNKGDFSFSIVAYPSMMFYFGNFNTDSVSKPKGGDIGAAITFFPLDRFSITFNMVYQQINSYMAGHLISKDKAIFINPYISYFPLESKKISIDVGWFYGNFQQELYLISQFRKGIVNGINYGLSYQHVFKKNLGFLNNHLGFQVYFHRICNLKKIEKADFSFLFNIKIGLIYHL